MKIYKKLFVLMLTLLTATCLMVTGVFAVNAEDSDKKDTSVKSAGSDFMQVLKNNVDVITESGMMSYGSYLGAGLQSTDMPTSAKDAKYVHTYVQTDEGIKSLYNPYTAEMAFAICQGGSDAIEEQGYEDVTQTSIEENIHVGSSEFPVTNAYIGTAVKNYNGVSKKCVIIAFNSSITLKDFADANLHLLDVDTYADFNANVMLRDQDLISVNLGSSSVSLSEILSDNSGEYQIIVTGCGIGGSIARSFVKYNNLNGNNVVAYTFGGSCTSSDSSNTFNIISTDDAMYNLCNNNDANNIVYTPSESFRKNNYGESYVKGEDSSWWRDFEEASNKDFVTSSTDVYANILKEIKNDQELIPNSTNGFTGGGNITVSGDCFKSFEGNIEAQSLCIDEGMLSVQGNFDVSTITLNDSSNYLYVEGDLSYQSVESTGAGIGGVIEVKGNYTHSGSYTMPCFEIDVILSGNEHQVVSTSGMDIYSHPGENFILKNSDVEFASGVSRITLAEDIFMGYSMNTVEAGELDLNGHNFSVSGRVHVYDLKGEGSISASEWIEVSRLSLERGTLDIYGFANIEEAAINGTLNVNGDLSVSNLTIGYGYVTVSGNLNLGTYGGHGGGSFVMENDSAYLSVDRDFNMGYVSCSLTAGTVELRGNFYPGNYTSSGSHRTVISGWGTQVIGDQSGAGCDELLIENLEIQNSMIDLRCRLPRLTLYKDMEFSQTTTLNVDTLFLNGYTLRVNGVLNAYSISGGGRIEGMGATINAGMISSDMNELNIQGCVSAGSLDISGNVNIEGSLLANGINFRNAHLSVMGSCNIDMGTFSMTNPDDYLTVDGDLSIGSSYSELTAGVVELRGNFTLMSPEGYRESGSHRTIFSGYGTQSINLNGADYSSVFQCPEFMNPNVVFDSIGGNADMSYLNLSQDMTLSNMGDLNIGTLCLNGYRLSVGGNVHINCLEGGGTIESMGTVQIDEVRNNMGGMSGLNIMGDLMVNTLEVSGGMTVNGNLRANNIRFNSGYLDVMGSCYIESYYGTGLTMTNYSDYLRVNGDLVLITSGMPGSYYDLSAGTVELTGNFIVRGTSSGDYTYYETGSHRTRFTGCGEQRIICETGNNSGIVLQNPEFMNPNVVMEAQLERIDISSDYYGMNCCTRILTKEFCMSGGMFTVDELIAERIEGTGTLYAGRVSALSFGDTYSNIDLYGNLDAGELYVRDYMTINGDLNTDKMIMCGGELRVTGNCTVGNEYYPTYGDIFETRDYNTRLTIDGNLNINTGYNTQTLSGCRVYFAGDLNIYGAGLVANGDNEFIANGQPRQTIRSNGSFDRLTLENTSNEGVVFESPVTVTTLFEHNGNSFTLYGNGEDSNFNDYDHDTLTDEVDRYPQMPAESIENAEIGVEDCAYTGNAIVPQVRVTLNGIVLREDEDYVVKCVDNVEIGTATVEVKGINTYVGSKTAEFNIYCGHNYKNTVVPATCNKGGYTLHECSVCGDSYKDSETPANGHSYDEDNICTVCGFEKLMTGDTDGDGKISVRDVTNIQMFLVNSTELTMEELEAADVNGDNEVNVRDVTCLQKQIAQQEDDADTGENVEDNTDSSKGEEIVTSPTESSEEAIVENESTETVEETTIVEAEEETVVETASEGEEIPKAS